MMLVRINSMLLRALLLPIAILFVLWGFQFITIGLLSHLVLQIRCQFEGAPRES